MTITGDIFLFFLGILALILMSMSHRNILYAFASSMIWFTLFMWLFFSDTPPLDIEKTWVQLLTYAFAILVFMPWIVRMDTEIKNEARGKNQGQAWKEWGATPKEEAPDRRAEYRKSLRGRMR